MQCENISQETKDLNHTSLEADLFLGFPVKYLDKDIAS